MRRNPLETAAYFRLMACCVRNSVEHDLCKFLQIGLEALAGFSSLALETGGVEVHRPCQELVLAQPCLRHPQRTSANGTAALDM